MWQGGLLDCVAIDSSENNGTFKIITKKMNVYIYVCVYLLLVTPLVTDVMCIQTLYPEEAFM